MVHIGIYTIIRNETLIIGLNMNGCIYAIYVLILALIVFCISIIICKIISRIHILSILLLGK